MIATQNIYNLKPTYLYYDYITNMFICQSNFQHIRVIFLRICGVNPKLFILKPRSRIYRTFSPNQ